jgi:hypothetical protein
MRVAGAHLKVVTEGLRRNLIKIGCSLRREPVFGQAGRMKIGGKVKKSRPFSGEIGNRGD